MCTCEQMSRRSRPLCRADRGPDRGNFGEPALAEAWTALLERNGQGRRRNRGATPERSLGCCWPGKGGRPRRKGAADRLGGGGPPRGRFAAAVALLRARANAGNRYAVGGCQE